VIGFALSPIKTLLAGIPLLDPAAKAFEVKISNAFSLSL